MDGNIIKLVFMSIAQGSGFSKVSAETAALRKNLGMAGQAAHLLGNAFGNIGNMAGGALSAVLRGNFWELGAIALNKTISLVKEHNELMRDARLAARGLSSDYRSLEKAAKGYLKRVESWKRAREEADAAEAESLKAKETAFEKAREQESSRLTFQQKYYALEQQIAEEIANREASGKDELEVLKRKIELMKKAAEISVMGARENLAYARQYGTGSEQDIAAKELTLAEERQKSVDAKARALVDAYSKKRDAALDEAARKREEKEEKRREKEEAEKRMKAEKEASAARKKEVEELRRHVKIESDKRSEIESALAEAVRRIEETKHFVGRAANMDQAGSFRADRQAAVDEERFKIESRNLKGSGKIFKGKDGVWKSSGRLSNLNQAILDRMNADENKRKLEKEQDKVVRKLDELIKKIEEMSSL